MTVETFKFTIEKMEDGDFIAGFSDDTNISCGGVGRTREEAIMKAADGLCRREEMLRLQANLPVGYRGALASVPHTPS